MYLSSHPINLKETAAPYENTQSNTNTRANRLCRYINYWMSQHQPDDQAWFERDFARAHPDYDDYMSIFSEREQGG
jgi:hypothetical protein